MKYVQPIGAAEGAAYIDGDPTSGTEGSAVPAAAIEHPQREILAVLESAGIAPDPLVLNQLAAAIQSGRLCSGVAGGTVDALTLVLSPAVVSLSNGMTVVFRAAGANTIVAPTLKVGSPAAKTIVKGANSALAVGDIAGAGHWLVVQFDGVLDKFVLLNPAKGINPASSSVLHVQDQRASGTAGQSLVATTWNLRTLQTVVRNDIDGASLAANQVTLPAGTYDVIASAAMHQNSIATTLHKLRLRNISAGNTVLLGSNEYMNVANAGTTGGNTARLEGRIVLAVSRVFELQHYSTTGASNLANSSGEAEVYASLFISKVA